MSQPYYPRRGGHSPHVPCLCEELAIAEQHVEAALQLGDVAGAHAVFEEEIKPHFKIKESQRALRLFGMILEANQEFDAAAELYREALKVNSANALLHKRLICVSKALGDDAAVLDRLNKYLRVFSQDWAAWIELAELHEAAGKFSFAAYCFEEVVLLQPGQPYPQVKVGECILKQLQSPASPARESSDASLGAALQARKHMAHAVRASNSTYARALWGLAIACVAFARLSRGTATAEEAVPAEAIDALQAGSSPGASSAELGTWSAQSATSSAADAAVAIPKDRVAADDNVGLFKVAVDGLQALYAAQGEASAATAKALQRLDVPATSSNTDGCIVGSWSSAKTVLSAWLADL